jgi:hypothetical protein
MSMKKEEDQDKMSHALLQSWVLREKVDENMNKNFLPWLNCFISSVNYKMYIFSS